MTYKSQFPVLRPVITPQHFFSGHTMYVFRIPRYFTEGSEEEIIREIEEKNGVAIVSGSLLNSNNPRFQDNHHAVSDACPKKKERMKENGSTPTDAKDGPRERHTTRERVFPPVQTPQQIPQQPFPAHCSNEKAFEIRTQVCREYAMLKSKGDSEIYLTIMNDFLQYQGLCPVNFASAWKPPHCNRGQEKEKEAPQANGAVYTLPDEPRLGTNRAGPRPGAGSNARPPNAPTSAIQSTGTPPPSLNKRNASTVTHQPVPDRMAETNGSTIATPPPPQSLAEAKSMSPLWLSISGESETLPEITNFHRWVEQSTGTAPAPPTSQESFLTQSGRVAIASQVVSEFLARTMNESAMAMRKARAAEVDAHTEEESDSEESDRKCNLGEKPVSVHWTSLIKNDAIISRPLAKLVARLIEKAKEDFVEKELAFGPFAQMLLMTYYPGYSCTCVRNMPK